MPNVDGTMIDFYPRSPRGERRSIGHIDFSILQFLSTLPARGATQC